MAGWQPPNYDQRQPRQQGYGQPPVQQQPYGHGHGQQPPPQYFARESETITGMSNAEILIHWTLIICSCGLWYPFYAARRHNANRKARTRYR